jgi:hypothetical protein
MTALILKSVRQAKKLIIAIIGFIVLLIGIAMIVLSGPAIVVIPIGLAVWQSLLPNLYGQGVC